MAPGSRPRRSPRRNPPADPMEDELSGAQGPAEGSGILSPAHGPAPSRDPSPAHVPAPTPAVVPTEELFQQFMKTYAASVKILERNQGAQAEPREKPIKANVPDVYYGKSHMDCYHFCQQCEDHFETARATGANRTSFAASFLRENISVRWVQYKTKRRGEGVAPITWPEFKAFLRKNLGESKSFVDSIWRKLKRDSQYQLEEVYDWSAHLEHLQSILIEFDPAAAPTESTMVRCFEEGLKPSIKVEMDQDATQLDSYEELVAKAVKAEAKAGMRPSSYVRETDLHCRRGSRPAHATAHKVQTQGYSKDNRTEEPKGSNSQRSDNAETSKMEKKKDRKKKWQQKKKQRRQEQGCKDSTPATEDSTLATNDNMAIPPREKARKDLSHITCFNCGETGHYADKCPKPREESDSSED